MNPTNYQHYCCCCCHYQQSSKQSRLQLPQNNYHQSNHRLLNLSSFGLTNSNPTTTTASTTPSSSSVSSSSSSIASSSNQSSTLSTPNLDLLNHNNFNTSNNNNDNNQSFINDLEEFSFDLFDSSRNLLLDDIEQVLMKEEEDEEEEEDSLNSDNINDVNKCSTKFIDHQSIINRSNSNIQICEKFNNINYNTINNNNIDNINCNNNINHHLTPIDIENFNFNLIKNSLKPSVQRFLFNNNNNNINNYFDQFERNNISMSQFDPNNNNNNNSNSNYLESSKQLNNKQHNFPLPNQQQQQQQLQLQQQQQQLSSLVASNQPLLHRQSSSHQLIRQDSQSLLFGGSCCSSTSNTNTSTFDSVSNYGGSSSTSSSTPSTPSSIIGGSSISVVTLQQQQQQQQQQSNISSSSSSASSSAATLISSLTSNQLPSFNEIYSPQGYQSSASLAPSSSIVTTESNIIDPQSSDLNQQQQSQSEINFEQFEADYFKFEDLFSESEGDFDSNNDILYPSTSAKIVTTSAIATARTNISTLKIKEESMDTFDDEQQQQFNPPSISSSTSTSNVQFNRKNFMQSIASPASSTASLGGPSIQSSSSMMIHKIEDDDDNNNESNNNKNININQINEDDDDDDDDLDEKLLKAADFLFSSPLVTSIPSTTTTTSSSPDLIQSETAKSMRLHLHNLSLNVLNSPIPSTSTCQRPLLSSYQQPSQPLTIATTETTTTTNMMPIEFNPSNINVTVSKPISSNISTLSSSPIPSTSTSSSSASASFRNNPAQIIKTSGRGHKQKSTTLQTCAVCGDVAACQHYGVLTCEGCKGFFKRTVQKGSKYTCLGNKDCTVDKRRRNRCQFCRFQKCLAVGMVKEVVRTDNLKGRRGRLPSKPKLQQQHQMYDQQQQQQQQQHPHRLPSMMTKSSQPLSTIASLLRAHEDTFMDKNNLDFSNYNEAIDEQIICDQYRHNLYDHVILSLLSSSLNKLWLFIERIPGFLELNELDRKNLFQNSCLELFALRLAYRLIATDNDMIILCNNVVLHRNQLMFTLPEWFPMIEELSLQLRSMNLDLNAFVCLCALTVITPRDCMHEDIQKIEQIENRIINSLRDHTIYNNEAQKKSNYFSRILTKLSELRTIGEFGTRIIMKKIQKLSSTITMTDKLSDLIELQRKISPIINQQQQQQQQMSNLSTTTATMSDLISHCDNPCITTTTTTTTTTQQQQQSLLMQQTVASSSSAAAIRLPPTTSMMSHQQPSTSTSSNQLSEIDIQTIASLLKDWPDNDR